MQSILTKKELESEIQIIAIKKNKDKDWIISQIDENEIIYESAKIIFLGTRIDIENIKI
ncbi:MULTISPECIES: hypothetical protein [Helicobacter]|uniref:Uncharacterized protein n=1 Tax=Helicobacter ibis TaxID=2962633 RepID=A0ABT4VFM0_9HELI|nr:MULTISPECIES: hypothetical protein [Helicobacter]MDA3967775.1 hypothetical protein [Helicobacter sp. WB40]MDA3969494.1 hypothetical protein [Helicobacter ibis]